MNNPNWQVQHEFDNEPTYVTNMADPQGENNSIVLESGIPVAIRRVLAQKIANMMNGHKLLDAAQAAYTRLSEFRNNWPGRGSTEGQKLLCDLRDAIAEETGQTPQQVQDGH